MSDQKKKVVVKSDDEDNVDANALASAPRKARVQGPQDFDKHSKLIASDMYNPMKWICRSMYLRSKGYIELAIGDAYKAVLLCNPLTRQSDWPNHPEVAGQRKSSQQFLLQLLLEIEAFDAVRDYIANMGDAEAADLVRPHGLDFVRAERDRPRMRRNLYDEIPSKYFTRSAADLKDIRKQFSKVGLGIKQSGLTNNASVLGVFAKKRLRVRLEMPEMTSIEPLFRDKTLVTEELDKRLHVREKKWLLLHHLDLLTERALDPDQPVSWHPLDDDEIKILTADYNGNSEWFSFQKHIKDVHTLLDSKHIPFYDPRFDWWVIFTLLWRLETNSFSDSDSSPFPSPTTVTENTTTTNPVLSFTQATWVGTASRYSFFNHSCDPNISWKPENSATTIKVNMIKEIKKGEECFISYITPDELLRGVDERRYLLRDWFGADCMCTRCKEEELWEPCGGLKALDEIEVPEWPQ